MIDVANEARVSQTTVSLRCSITPMVRACRRRPLHERVVKAAARLGYQQVRRGFAPGAAAAASIGFVCDEISDRSTGPPLVSTACAREAWERGLTVMVMATRGDADMEKRAALAQLTAQPLAGLIYATINTRLIDAPAPLWRMPAVLLNCHVANGALPSIVPGEVAGGMRRDGRTSFAPATGASATINGEASMESDRGIALRAYRQALAIADLPFDPDLVREGNWQPHLRLRGGAGTHEPQEASDRDLLCANDLMAVGWLRGAA